MLEKAERRNGISGSDIHDAIRLMRTGFRALDRQALKVAHNRLSKITGKPYATNVAIVEYDKWQEELGERESG